MITAQRMATDGTDKYLYCTYIHGCTLYITYIRMGDVLLA